MEKRVATVAASPDPTYGHNPTAQLPDTGASAVRAARGPDPVDMRLVIEEDEATGSYVYKQVNRRTGEVLMQFPRDDVLKMRQQFDYEAGRVIRAKA
jgi:flagellar protein FlaG